MNVFGQDTRTPLVVERSGHAVAITGGGATTTVLARVASIHAAYIDVFVTPTVALDSVSLVLYAANGKIALTQQIHAAIVAGVTHSVRWGGSLTFAAAPPSQGQAVGQFYDVIVKTDAGAANGTINVWTAARS